MKQRALGTTGLFVSEIALGAGPLGDEAALDDAAAVRLIHEALALGITLVDTAPSYGRSEARIGAALRGRRDRVIVSTKLGYDVPGVPDWTAACITGGVDLALARLGTEWIDIAHLHACGDDVLARGEVIDALDAAVRAGKVRVAAYSGDNEALERAIASGRFGVVQCSLSIADQVAIDLPFAGLGVLAKRSLANAVWRHASRPAAPDRAAYWDRLREMRLPPPGEDPAAFALRFVLAQPCVSAALVGTTSIANLRAAVAAAERGPLDDAAVNDVRRRFVAGWRGVI